MVYASVRFTLALFDFLALYQGVPATISPREGVLAETSPLAGDLAPWASHDPAPDTPMEMPVVEQEPTSPISVHDDVDDVLSYVVRFSEDFCPAEIVPCCIAEPNTHGNNGGMDGQLSSRGLSTLRKVDRVH